MRGIIPFCRERSRTTVSRTSHLATLDEMRFEYKGYEQEMETLVKASLETP